MTLCDPLLSIIDTLRQRYRRAALLVAAGQAAPEVAAALGWSLSFTESLIADDPAFANLVSQLRNIATDGPKS